MTDLPTRCEAAGAGEQRAFYLQARVDEAMRHYHAMTPAEQAAMWQAQRESWLRAEQPCEHGDPDWDECPKCLAAASLRAGENHD